jgi:hypothetical protein
VNPLVFTASRSIGGLTLLSLREQVLQGATSGSHVLVNLKEYPTLNSLEAATLLRLVLEGRKQGVEIRFAHVSQQARQAFTGLEAGILKEATQTDADLSPVEEVGEQTLELVAAGRQILEIVGEIAHGLFIAPWRGRGIKWIGTVEQIVKIGVEGVPIVTFLSLFDRGGLGTQRREPITAVRRSDLHCQSRRGLDVARDGAVDYRHYRGWSEWLGNYRRVRHHGRL